MLQRIKDWWKKTWNEIKFFMNIPMEIWESPATLGLREFKEDEITLINTARNQVAIVVKAFNSVQEREMDAEPIETKTVYTTEELDDFVEKYSFPAKYLGFESGAGIKLKSRDAARYFLMSET